MIIIKKKLKFLCQPLFFAQASMSQITKLKTLNQAIWANPSSLICWKIFLDRMELFDHKIKF